MVKRRSGVVSVAELSMFVLTLELVAVAPVVSLSKIVLSVAMTVRPFAVVGDDGVDELFFDDFSATTSTGSTGKLSKRCRREEFC